MFIFSVLEKIGYPERIPKASRTIAMCILRILKNRVGKKERLDSKWIKSFLLSGKRDSDPRPQPWQGCALPTELLPHYWLSLYCEEKETRTPTGQLPLPPQSSASTIPPPLQIFRSYQSCPEQDSNLHVRKDIRTWNVRVYHSTTWALFERKTGLGPATPTLARLCSTNWATSAWLLCFQKRCKDTTYF